MSEIKTFTLDPVTHTIEAPVFQSHRRGKNWMAVISPNPKSPGGLERVFYPAARGEEGRYIVGGLTICAVEFGADYYSGSGKKNSTRWYGCVRQITRDSVTIERFETARQAWDAAQESRKVINEIMNGESMMDDQRQAEAFGDISSQDMLNELVRRGVLVHETGPGFDRLVHAN